MRVASILVLLRQVFVLDKGLTRGVLLLAFLSDFFVFFGHDTLFELLELLLVLRPRGSFILALGVEFALQDFSMRQLVWVVGQRVVPLWARLEVGLSFALCFGFLLA